MRIDIKWLIAFKISKKKFNWMPLFFNAPAVDIMRSRCTRITIVPDCRVRGDFFYDSHRNVWLRLVIRSQWDIFGIRPINRAPLLSGRRTPSRVGIVFRENSPGRREKIGSSNKSAKGRKCLRWSDSSHDPQPYNFLPVSRKNYPLPFFTCLYIKKAPHVFYCVFYCTWRLGILRCILYSLIIMNVWYNNVYLHYCNKHLILKSLFCNNWKKKSDIIWWKGWNDRQILK